MTFRNRIRSLLGGLAPQRASQPAGWIPGRWQAPRRGHVPPRAYEYFLYLPTAIRRRERLPLLLMLHGCSQDAASFAHGTRMNELAEAERFVVLYPQQSPLANPLRCWNWFDPDGSGAAEASAIAALVRQVMRRYPIERSRVYVAGMSAGGAMAVMLALCHGRLFAACAVVSGLMYRAAGSALGAVQAMRAGTSAPALSTLREARRRAGRTLRFVPALIVHGQADSVVNPRNAARTVEQFSALASLCGGALQMQKEGAAAAADTGRQYRQRDYQRGGALALREVLIDGLGHAWSGGDPRYPFNDPTPPDTSRLIWDFVSRCGGDEARLAPLGRWWRRLFGS